MTRQYALLFCLLLPLMAAPLRAADRPEVRVERKLDAMLVEMEEPVAVDVATAWQVLTDYDHLAEFVPDMQVSRIVSRNGRVALVEQQGVVWLLVFRADIRVTLRVDEYPRERLAFRAVDGNVKRMQGQWRVRQDGKMIKLSYRAEIEPDFWVPPFLGSELLRQHVEKQVSGLVQEMLRRYPANISPLTFPET